MKEQSLHQVMNDMVKRLDTIRPNDPSKRAPEALSELEAFIRIDDLLANLNKQYLDAKSQRETLVALNGADDAMAEIAFDMEDSAWCAMQTRYLELRAKRDLMERAQRMVRQAQEQIKYFKKREVEKDKLKTLHFLKMLNKMKIENRAKSYLYFVLILFMDKNFWGPRQNYLDNPVAFAKVA